MPEKVASWQDRMAAGATSFSRTVRRPARRNLRLPQVTSVFVRFDQSFRRSSLQIRDETQKVTGSFDQDFCITSSTCLKGSVLTLLVPVKG